MQGQYDNTNKGGGWITTSKKGVQYVNIKVNIDGTEHKLAMFKVDQKKSPKAPDYNIVVSKPKDGFVSNEQIQKTLDPTDNVPF